MKKIIENYQSLEIKEQKAIQVAGLAVILFVLYQFIFLPFSITLEKSEKQLQFQSNLNQWLKRVVPKTPVKRNKAKITLTSSELLSNTDKNLKHSTLSTYQYDLSQSDPSTVQLNFKKVPYTDYIQWLENFFDQRALTIKELNINQLNEAGLVSCTLHFGLDPSQ